MSSFQEEVKQGKRFQFGKNWSSFLDTLDDERITVAEASILEMLELSSLAGLTVLDVGNGSGLFSLAARRLGAKVVSFDFDPASVECARTLKQRFFPDDADWSVCEGSVLDRPFLDQLGQFDVVYSWGVLHHTGQMWTALENVAARVKQGGRLFIALYNKQGVKSVAWKHIKQVYCSGLPGKAAVTSLFVPYFAATTLAASALSRRNLFAEYKQRRGMSIVHDWHDWLGGLPFETASVEEVFAFFKQRGFDLVNIRTTNSLGNNQFVFLRVR